MRKTFWFVLLAASVLLVLSFGCIYAAVQNPEDFERYTPTFNWAPTLSDDGWITDCVGDPAQIGDFGVGGSQGLELTGIAPTSAGADKAFWYASLDQGTNSHQFFRYDFELVSYNEADPTFVSSVFRIRTGDYSAVAYVSTGIFNSGSTRYCEFYSGDMTDGGSLPLVTQIPGKANLALGNWFTMEVEVDYSRTPSNSTFVTNGWMGQVRARLSPLGGSPYGWSNWADIGWAASAQYGPVAVQTYGTTIWDNLQVTTVASGSLTGTITLPNYSGDFSLTPVKIHLVPISGGADRTETITLGGSPGSYSIDAVAPGTYNIVFQCAKCLTKIARNVIVASGAVPTVVDQTLPNGALGGGNAISAADLNIVLSNLDLTGDSQ